MLKSHYRISQAAGISINLQANGEVIIHACSVIIKDNKLDIDKKITDLDHIDDLKRHFPQKTLVSLNLFGKGILQKQVGRLDEINANTFAQILPNGNPEDFYIQNFVSGESSFISVIRKNEADKWIETIRNLGFIPLILSLGPAPVQQVMEQLNFYDDQIVFDGHFISRNASKEWQGYTYTTGGTADFPLKIGPEVVNEKLILAYSAAFQLALSPDIELIHANVSALNERLADFLSDKKFKVRGFLALCVFFILLLINFLAFTSLNSDNERLSEQLSISARNVSDVEGVARQAEAKERLLKTLGWDGGMNKARMFDQLSSLLPEDIRLLEMTINPVDVAATRIQKTISFSDRTIRIVGSSENILPVNEWIARIKTMKWVRTIQMDSYVFNSELAAGQFIIKISY